eukprot:XP_763947.1 hypothetical protein [Theileria parva strain Muguga]
MPESKGSVSINFEEVALKLNRLLSIFKRQEDEKIDLLFVCTGKSQSESNSTTSELLQLWLTGFQFPETLIVFTSDGRLSILTSPKKGQYLEPLVKHYEKVKFYHRVPGQNDEPSLNKIFASFNVGYYVQLFITSVWIVLH